MTHSILKVSLLALVCTIGSIRAEDKPAGDTRVFELRTYTAAPGKFEALMTRFRDHSNALFAKHGMQMVAFWTPTDGDKKDNTLIYILAFPSRDAAKKAWADFRADPDWVKASAESEAKGPLTTKVVSVFMSPTDFSPIK